MTEQSNVNEFLAGLSDEEKASLIKAALKAKEAKQNTRLGEEYFAEKYAGETRWSINPGSLHFSEADRKQALTLTCGCGTEFERFTSDLHTCHGCEVCTAKAKREAGKVRRLRLKAAAELLKQQEA